MSAIGTGTWQEKEEISMGGRAREEMLLPTQKHPITVNQGRAPTSRVEVVSCLPFG